MKLFILLLLMFFWIDVVSFLLLIVAIVLLLFDVIGHCYTELQKRADRADQSVLFFLAGANFWEKHAKNRRKQAKTGEKQALFWC